MAAAVGSRDGPTSFVLTMLELLQTAYVDQDQDDLEQNPATLQPDQIYTMGVDSGHGSLLDASAVGVSPNSTSQARSWTGFSSRFGARSRPISWWTRRQG